MSRELTTSFIYRRPELPVPMWDRVSNASALFQPVHNMWCHKNGSQFNFTCSASWPLQLGLSSGRAIAQTVSRGLPTLADWVPARVLWDLWWTKWRWGRFSPSTPLPLPIFIPLVAPQSPSRIIWDWYNRPEVAAVQGTWSHPIKSKKK
jgi:hypothetical protein